MSGKFKLDNFKVPIIIFLANFTLTIHQFSKNIQEKIYCARLQVSLQYCGFPFRSISDLSQGHRASESWNLSPEIVKSEGVHFP